MVKKRASIVLIVALAIAAVVLFCTISNSADVAKNISDAKEKLSDSNGYSYFSDYYSETREKLDQVLFSAICFYILEAILLILPALTAFHFTCTIDDKNAIAYAKANNKIYSGRIQNHGTPVMIEAAVGCAAGIVLSIFTGAIYGWGDDYTSQAFFHPFMISFVVCGVHFINGLIISAFDERNYMKISSNGGNPNAYAAPAYSDPTQMYYNSNNVYPNAQYPNPNPQMYQPVPPVQNNQTGYRPY